MQKQPLAKAASRTVGAAAVDVVDERITTRIAHDLAAAAEEISHPLPVASDAGDSIGPCFHASMGPLAGRAKSCCGSFVRTVGYSI